MIGEQRASKNVALSPSTKYTFQLYSISSRDDISCSESQAHVPHNGQLSKVQQTEIRNTSKGTYFNNWLNNLISQSPLQEVVSVLGKQSMKMYKL